MTVPVPNPTKLYHIVHLDRLPSIVADGFLWCDSEVVRRAPAGTIIGMSSIKQRRLNELHLSSHPDLHVGDCVPFYFCPRSVMLYLIHQGNHPELTYRGGQGPILHFEADLHAVVAWANAQPALGFHALECRLIFFRGPQRSRASGRDQLDSRAGP